jgi:2,3,4,5-tetrahydropyridine-2-carboxylate N-succinyltransferase
MLLAEIERLRSLPVEEARQDGVEFARRFRQLLNRGELRSAEKVEGKWRANTVVKQGILLCFRLGFVVEMSAGTLAFADKDTLPVRGIDRERNLRVVPGGSSIRDGAYIGQNVICMPPMFINIGAYVDDGSMVDSHALVGSCAQIGKRVHLSAAAQIGGVLEPAGAVPVVIEDDAFIGGNCGIYEGVVVGERAVLAPGTILSGGTAVYDLVHGMVYRRSEAGPLTIPPGAVVVPGSRPAAGEFAAAHGLALYAPVIVKYRDGKTDAATSLESALR